MSALTTEQVVSLTTDQIVALPTVSLAAMTTDQVAAMETRDIEALTPYQLQKLPTSLLTALTTAQIVALTTEQIESLPTASLVTLTTLQVAALETRDIQALLGSQVQKLTASQLGALSAAQLRAIETDDVSAMSWSQIGALSTDQLTSLTSEQKSAIVAKGLTTGTTALTADQKMIVSSNNITPVMLDLNGNGIQTLGLSQGTQFDLAAQGEAHRVGWVSPTDGLLVRDLNNNGIIQDGRELFGSSTVLPDGQTAQDGYQALQALDINNDGVLDSRDESFASLQVWVDSDSDAFTDAGELKSLADLSIASLDLHAKAGSNMDQGNLVGLVSSYQTTDGAQHAMADVWLQVAPEDLRKNVTQMTQALAELSGDADVFASVSTQAGGEVPTPSLQTLLAQPVSPMAQALAQFDANGQPYATASSLMLASDPTNSSTQKLLTNPDDPNKPILGSSLG
jgi:hypothetical protein